MQIDFPRLSLSTFPFDNISLILNGHILLALLIIFLIFYSVISGVLFYHWSAYGMRHFGVLMAESLFSIVSIALFCVAFLSLFYF